MFNAPQGSCSEFFGNLCPRSQYPGLNILNGIPLEFDQFLFFGFGSFLGFPFLYGLSFFIALFHFLTGEFPTSFSAILIDSFKFPLPN